MKKNWAGKFDHFIRSIINFTVLVQILVVPIAFSYINSVYLALESPDRWIKTCLSFGFFGYGSIIILLKKLILLIKKLLLHVK